MYTQDSTSASRHAFCSGPSPAKQNIITCFSGGDLEAWTGDWLIFLMSLVPADTAFARCACT
eukprot:4237169-Pyramimonas_sp.AAC.1